MEMTKEELQLKVNELTAIARQRSTKILKCLSKI